MAIDTNDRKARASFIETQAKDVLRLSRAVQESPGDTFLADELFYAGCALYRQTCLLRRGPAPEQGVLLFDEREVA